MKQTFSLILFALLVIFFTACDAFDPFGGQTLSKSDAPCYQLDSLGWYWETECPVDLSKSAYTAETPAMKLHFFGWSQDEDSVFVVNFPADCSNYGRAIVSYTMCGWNQGPADWDMTTQIMVQDQQTNEWYEFTRCFTPYGGYFTAAWDTTFYIDVTEMLPLFRGETKFKIFYCGWDATDKKAHAVRLRFDLFEGRCLYGSPVGHEKLYDSTLSGNTGYRSWAYGVQGEGNSIETDGRLDSRTLHFPSGANRAVLRVCFTGHGQDGVYGYSGYFLNADGSKRTASNAAEFDKNHYTILLDGEALPQQGLLWELNSAGNNYKQAGTYKYNRCGWGPGKPANVQHWIVNNPSGKARDVSIDFNLDNYISNRPDVKGEGVAQFYVEVDAYYYK